MVDTTIKVIKGNTGENICDPGQRFLKQYFKKINKLDFKI